MTPKAGLRRLADLAHEAAPPAFAVLGFLAGAVMLASSLLPAFSARLDLLARVTPVVVVELTHFAASIAGFLLLLVSAGLWRRRRGAYWAALALLAAGAAFSLAKGLDYEEAAGLLAVAGLLAPFRNAFDRPSRVVFGPPSRPVLFAVAGLVAALFALSALAFSEAAYTGDLWWTFLAEESLPRSLRAGAAVAILTLLLAARVLLSGPPSQWRGRPSGADIARARAVLAAAGDAAPDAQLALLGDKDLFFSPSGASFIPFRVRAQRWIAMGEPAGDPAEFQDLMWAYVETADRWGARAVFYGVSPALLPHLATMGMNLRKVGEAAIIDLERFSLEGRAKQDLRTARNRARREGVTAEVLGPGEVRAAAAELKAVSDAWLARSGGPEKGFSLGRFDLDYLDRGEVVCVRRDGGLLAFASLMESTPRGEAAVDLMRHMPDAPPGLMDFLFVSAIEHVKAKGLRRLSLGMTPLAGLDERRLAPTFARIGAFVFDEGGGLYGFRGLRAYKAKFGPRWEPVFMAAAPGVPLTFALLDVALLTSGGWRGVFGLKS